MSLLLASVFASTALTALGNSSADKARKEADEIAKYQDLIAIEEQAQSNYISQYNQTRALTSAESSQVANSAGMGKRSSSASLVNMQEIARADQDKNFKRMDDSISLSREIGTLTDSARKSATKTKRATDMLNLGASVARNGLLLSGKK